MRFLAETQTRQGQDIDRGMLAGTEAYYPAPYICFKAASVATAQVALAGGTRLDFKSCPAPIGWSSSNLSS